MQSAAVRQKTQYFYDNLKRRNVQFIGQNRAIKTDYCEKWTNNKNKKDNPQTVFFMQ